MRIWQRTFSLLKSCWKVVVLFEILYRLFSRYAVFPAMRFLFNTCLRLTGLKYFTGENALRMFTHPVMIGCMGILFIIFSLTTMVEFSCLITCLHSAERRENYGILQVVIEGFKDSFRMLHPRNFIALIITALLVPLIQLPTSTSMLRLIEIPWTSLAAYMQSFPYNLLAFTYIALILALVALVPCGYQFYVVEDLHTREALRRARKLNRRRGLPTFLSVLSMVLLAILVAFGGSALLSKLLQKGLAAVTSDINLQYRIRLPFDTLFLFVKSSLPSVMAVSLLSATYYTHKEWRNERLHGQALPYLKDAKRYNDITFIVVVTICLLSMVLYDTVLRPTLVRIDAFDFLASHPTLVIAHRGDTQNNDENTMGAFNAAIEIGVDYIELDVQLTKDGEIIVNHDKTYARVFGAKKKVWEVPLDETRDLKSKRTGANPPTLREVLTECDPQANFLIELKNNGHDAALPGAVFDLLTELECADRCIIQSSSYQMLKDFKQLAPDMRCGYILSFALGQYSSLEAVDFYSLDSSFVTQKVLNRIHAADKALYVWTVNDESLMTDMLALGVDGIITDDTPSAKNTLLSLSSNPLDELLTEPIDSMLAMEGDLAEEAENTEA
ncbi:MAG: hypothetical protein E7317_04740 [Clostridiales bacterium]|nr:hypothetical protein [Clostridiales bacterium]